MRLTSNGMAGPIPPELGNLATLQSLFLPNNDLTGPVPPALGNLANLQRLFLWSNELTGPVPPELGNLANLQSLSLRDNELTGPVPPALGNLANLQSLSLEDNDLTSSVPPELGNLANLRSLSLRNNHLTGPIPPELGNLAELRTLQLESTRYAGNRLTGPIPPELGNLANLQRLFLWSNDLTGPIPPELGNLANLQSLSLEDNDLTGAVPPELGNLANLQSLSLGDNELTGPVPPELGNLANLQSLSLRDNELTGPVPPALGNLANLQSLSLQNNDLTGPIPPELGSLSALKRLLLDGNNLAGPVPPEFGSLTSLVTLNLSWNAGLSGALPAGLISLGQLEALGTSGTNLCAPSDVGFLSWLEGVLIQRVARCEGAALMAYLTQAVQSHEFPVPLVAGEEALLRVFLTAVRSNSEDFPPVRATFYRNGAESHVVNIPGKSGPIPTEMDEGDLTKSANAEIPEKIVQPGLEMVIEIDPQGTLDLGLGVAMRIPATGRMAVDVRTMPLFDLTVIPFLWSTAPDRSILEMVQRMATDPEGGDLLLDARILLPVGALDVTAHEPVVTSTNNVFELLGATGVIRAMEGGSGHYLGTMAGRRSGGGLGGVAHLPGRASFASPDSSTIAHELGHNFNLGHAPGCTTGDPSFPEPNGRIGAWGYSSSNGGRLVSPRTHDLMSYCDPTWVSDYHFTKALRFRLRDEGGGDAAVAAAPAKSILLWGGTDAEGEPFLNPAFVVDAPPLLPDATGEHRITGRTASGDELFSLEFAAPAVADGNGNSSFAFVLPAEPDWAGSLASITLSGPGGSATLDSDTDPSMAILLDPRTSQVRGILRNLPQADAAVALAPQAGLDGLDVLFSSGIPDAAAWGR